MAIKRGWRRSMRSAPKFIILSEVRTGGTVLSDTLSGHPDLRVLGELLNLGPDDYWPAFRRTLVAEVTPQLRDVTPGYDCSAFLQLVFERYDGFVLHREHQLSDDNPAWQTLAERPDLRIIHLERRNLFRQYLSHQLALSSGIWHVSAQDSRTPERHAIRIDPTACFRTLHRWQEVLVARRELFRGRPGLTVEYEAIQADFSRVIVDCLAFLGVAPRPLPIRYRKLPERPLSELVTNLEEVRARLAETEFAPMLE